MRRLSLLLFLAACGAAPETAATTPANQTDEAPAAVDPFAGESTWRFQVDYLGHAVEDDDSVTEYVTETQEITCRLQTGTVTCDDGGQLAFMTGAWTATDEGFVHDDERLTAMADGELRCWRYHKEPDPDALGKDADHWTYDREICVGADGIESASDSEQKPAGNGSGVRAKRIR